jgi:predicted phosphodiesterase
MHTYACKQGNVWYDPDSVSSKTLLRKAKQFDLIITGHNHDSFVIKVGGRLLVNPGSIMRSTTKQINHKPRVYLWYDEDNHVEPVFLPIEKNVLSTEVIEEKKKEDIQNNKVRRSVENLIWESLDNEN